MNYNKDLFVENVYLLAKQRQMKLKDLETGCGVSIGYISRLRQGQKNIAPGADFLLAVADQLSVSVDSLLTFDFSHATDSEMDLLRFIEKLIRETTARRQSWQEDPGGYLDTVPVNPDGFTPHPLFISIPGPDGSPAVSYHSMFHLISGGLTPVRTYGSIFPGGRTLYLVHVWNTGDDQSLPGDWTELELVMTGQGIEDPIPLCHTDHEHPSRLDRAMDRLFAAVEDAAVLPLLSAEARRIIGEYLNEEANSRGEGSNE